MPPTGFISEPSQDSIRCRRSDGRTKASSGVTTVGPDTTKIAPVISAAPPDMPSSGPASTAANAIVIGTPQITKAGHHPAGAPLHLAPLQRQAGVIQDHRDRERDQRLERRAQQVLRVDVGGKRARRPNPPGAR